MNKNKVALLLLFLIVTALGAQAGGGKARSAPPSYYTLEDLRSGLKGEYFWFANNNKPLYARVDLGYSPIYAASTAKRAALNLIVLPNPAQYRIKASRATCSWIDENNLLFDWVNFRDYVGGRRGDLIFTRSNGLGPDIVKIFSNWTHVAIVNDPAGKTVFESSPSGGVRVNYAPAFWGNLSYYTCKRINTLDSRTTENLLDTAIRNYQGVPYFPNILTSQSLSTFLYRWCDKNDLSSMYCSKLIYQTFKSRVDFDTNNTSIYNTSLQDRASGAAYYSWIGISPDDIYYASCLGADFGYSANLNYI
jgi:hypothetical protein